MVLQGNQWQGKSWGTAKPELQWDVKCGLWKRVTRRAHGRWDINAGTGRVDVSERWVSQVCQLHGLSNHLVVTTLLLGGQAQLVPDVHPVTVLAVDALSSDLNLNHRNQLLTWVVQPASVGLVARSRVAAAVLADLRKCNLKVCAVGKVTISGDRALHTATEVSLSVERLFNGFHSKVGVSAVCNLPESDLWVTCKVDVLSAIRNELH